MSYLLRSVHFLSLAAGLTALSLTSAAHAGSSCTKDVDCGEGFRCDLVATPSTSGCASSDGTPCDEPTAPDAPTESIGYCREKPIPCDSDAQCPSYLSCQTENVGLVTCASPPPCPEGQACPEEPACDEPTTPPDAAKLCAPRWTECTADSQCPADFACNIQIGGGCIDVACSPGEDCPQPTCDEPKKVCGPKQIACQDNSDCPSDWRCLSFDESSCVGSGGEDPDDVTPPSSGGGSTPVPAPKGGSSKPLDTSGCTTTTQNFCVPRGYLGGLESRASDLGDVESSGAPGVSSGGSTKDSSAPTYSAPQGTTANGAAAASSSSDGGCSTSHRGASGGGLVGVMLAALGACLARRRR